MFDDLDYRQPYASARSPVMGNNVVACSQPLAAQAGLDILRQGGNAVDAAIGDEPTAVQIALIKLLELLRLCTKVGERRSGKAKTGEERSDSRSTLLAVNEHSESVFNAASPSAATFRTEPC